MFGSSSSPLFKHLVTTWRFQPVNPTPQQTLDSGIVPNKDPSVSSRANYIAQGTRDYSHSVSITDGDTPSPTLLSIDLEYEFANPAHAGVASMFFSTVSGMMVKAFEERLRRVYGPRDSIGT